jgi:hypothetical protein
MYFTSIFLELGKLPQAGYTKIQLLLFQWYCRNFTELFPGIKINIKPIVSVYIFESISLIFSSGNRKVFIKNVPLIFFPENS